MQVGSDDSAAKNVQQTDIAPAMFPSSVEPAAGRRSVEIRRQSVSRAVATTPEVIHMSTYRRRRRAKIGGPVVSLEAGIVRQRSYTNVASVVAFMIYAGIMARACIFPHSLQHPKFNDNDILSFVLHLISK